MQRRSENSKATIIGRPARAHTPGLSKWMVKIGYRLNQKCSEPGVYPMTLVVGDDGSRKLILDGGKVEDLGR